MVNKFPKFSQALAQDPATRRIWYGIATAHDFESHDGMLEETLYQKIFASHFGHLAIITLIGKKLKKTSFGIKTLAIFHAKAKTAKIIFV